MSRVNDAVNAALNEMYEKAEPSADFDHIRENPDEYPDDWYSQHKLDSEEQKRIARKYAEEYNLSDREHAGYIMTVITGMGPAGTGEEE